jgi:predicted secreted protein
MTITAGLVLYAVIWFMVFFVVLPLRMVTQADAGEVVPGTPRSAPAEVQIMRKAKITTLWATGVFVVIAGVIISDVISVRDLDWFGRMDPVAVGE